MEKSGNSVTTHTRLFKSSRKKPKSQNVSPKPPSKGFLFKEDLLDIQRKLNEEMKLSALKAIQPDELIDVPKPSGGKECKKQIVSEVKSIQTNPQCIKSMDNLDFSRVYKVKHEDPLSLGSRLFYLNLETLLKKRRRNSEDC